MAREYTNRVLDLVDEGVFDKDSLIQDLLGWLSEDEVREMVQRNDYYGFADLNHARLRRETV